MLGLKKRRVKARELSETNAARTVVEYDRTRTRTRGDHSLASRHRNNPPNQGAKKPVHVQATGGKTFLLSVRYIFMFRYSIQCGVTVGVYKSR